MLAIILGILKFIGLLLLGILGLAVFLLLLVLFVPVRYRARGSYYGAIKGNAGVSWLLHILSCQVVYDGEADVCIRVFGIRLGGRKRTGESETEEPKRNVREDLKREKIRKEKDAPQTEAPKKKPEAGSGQSGEAQKMGEHRETGNRQKDEIHGKAGAEQDTGKHRKFSLGNPLEKIRVTFQRICDKLETINEKKEQILDFINQEDNRNTFRLLKRQVYRLLKHILPGKVKGRVKFGFDDPYTTGQILTWVSPFYGLYAKKLQLIPSFDEKVLEGELNLKGRIRLGTVTAIAVRMLFDKNFRTLLKKWRQA